MKRGRPRKAAPRQDSNDMFSVEATINENTKVVSENALPIEIEFYSEGKHRCSLVIPISKETLLRTKRLKLQVEI